MTPYELAKAEIGTVEWKDGDNPKVVGYFRDAGHPEVKNDETAWCAAFVGAMLHRAGLPKTGQLNARSYLELGTPIERKDAQEGDIVIFSRGSSSWQGHVGFFVQDNGDTITVLGGNQSNAVCRRAYGVKSQTSTLLGIRRIARQTQQEAPASAISASGRESIASMLARALAAIFGGAR